MLPSHRSARAIDDQLLPYKQTCDEASSNRFMNKTCTAMRGHVVTITRVSTRSAAPRAQLLRDFAPALSRQCSGTKRRHVFKNKAVNATNHSATAVWLLQLSPALAGWGTGDKPRLSKPFMPCVDTKEYLFSRLPTVQSLRHRTVRQHSRMALIRHTGCTDDRFRHERRLHSVQGLQPGSLCSSDSHTRQRLIYLLVRLPVCVQRNLTGKW